MTRLNLSVGLNFLPFCEIIISNKKKFPLPFGLRQWSHDIDPPHIKRLWAGYLMECSGRGMNNIALFFTCIVTFDELFGLLLYSTPIKTLCHNHVT